MAIFLLHFLSKTCTVIVVGIVGDVLGNLFKIQFVYGVFKHCFWGSVFCILPYQFGIMDSKGICIIFMRYVYWHICVNSQ